MRKERVQVAVDQLMDFVKKHPGKPIYTFVFPNVTPEQAEILRQAGLQVSFKLLVPILIKVSDKEGEAI